MFSIAFADAQLSAGKVIAADGDVFASNGGAPKRPLKRNDDFFSKDVITTGEAASASLRFVDGTLVELREKTSYKISDYHYTESEPEKDSYFIELLYGAFRTITGELGKRSPTAYQIKAETTTLTIQGTAYTLGIQQNVDAFIEEGAVNLKLPTGQEVRLDTEHPGIEVTPNGQFTRTFSMPASLSQGFKPGGFNQLRQQAAAAAQAGSKGVFIKGEGRQAPPKPPPGEGVCKASSSGA